MFVGFRQSRDCLQVSLVEARRYDGKVRNHHIAGLGSIINAPTIADRVVFWQRASQRLEALGNRIGPEIEKVEAALHVWIAEMFRLPFFWRDSGPIYA